MEKWKTCTECGTKYQYLCVHCRQMIRQEGVEFLMDKYGLTDDRLIEELANHVIGKESGPALFKAINMKGMGSADKVEVGGPDGGPIAISDPGRIASILARSYARGRDKEDAGKSESGGAAGDSE